MITADDIVVVAYSMIIKQLHKMEAADQTLIIEYDIDNIIYPIMIKYHSIRANKFCLGWYRGDLFWWPLFQLTGHLTNYKIDLTNANCFIDTAIHMIDGVKSERSKL